MNKKYILIISLVISIFLVFLFFVYNTKSQVINPSNKGFIKNENSIKNNENDKYFVNDLTGEKIFSENEPDFLK